MMIKFSFFKSFSAPYDIYTFSVTVNLNYTVNFEKWSLCDRESRHADIVVTQGLMAKRSFAITHRK